MGSSYQSDESKADEGKARGRGGVKSCLRTLEVLEYFMAAGAPARTIEISEAIGIPNSSADEILRTLAMRGYLSYSQATKLYSPSYKLVANAAAIGRSFFGHGRIEQMMEDLRRETGASVFLTQQNDCWTENVAEVMGSWLPGPRASQSWSSELICFERNAWLPATNFAAAMLAQQSNIAIVQLATRKQSLGLGPSRPTSMKDLVDRIGQTRTRGFSLRRRRANIPVDSIAMPLRVPHSVAYYAVGVVGDPLFENDSDVRRMLGAMQSVICNYNEDLRRMEGQRLQ